MARFNTGLQILRQKVDEWNSVAHRLNNFKDLEFEIAELIQKWMRMELQCWRESMDQSLEMVRSKAYRYWFFLYNLIHEFLAGSADGDNESSLVDFNDVEKRFAGDEVMEEKPTAGKISVGAITKVLRQFIESSNYAEFHLRLRLLKSFERYLAKSSGSANKRQLIAIMHNLHLYFSQFAPQVQEQIDFVRKPVEKKLKEFVKIESFNKDLSYFSMRSNIQRVHRHLHKILKEFELEVVKKISDLFLYKDSAGEFQEFRTSPNTWKPTDLPVDVFIARHVQELTPATTFDDSSKETLQKIVKFVVTSRKIVRKSLENAPYPTLLESFQDMMDKELETCTHLRSLEVDREQPRNKQKSQAKHILIQKRKALSDFFKNLALMGVSYRTGLLTNQLNAELTDLQIAAFSVDSVTCEDLQLHNRIRTVSQKLDLYFTKSVLKMKLLANALLMPRPDMDHGFLERMKGFAIDFFMMVQEQRKSLSSNVNELGNLGKLIKDVETVKAAGSRSLNFEAENKKLSIVLSSLVEASEVMAQFKILLKCSPDEANSCHKVVNSSNNTFHQRSHLYGKIAVLTDDIIGEIKSGIEAGTKDESRFTTTVHELVATFDGIVGKLGELKQLFAVENEISVYAKSICELHIKLTEKSIQVDALSSDTMQISIDIDDKLDNLAHTILVVIQNIYKKFEKEATTDDDGADLLANHLKEKLHSELSDDISALKIEKINKKLRDVLDSMFASTNLRTNHQLVSVLPLVKQFDLLAKFFFVQQLSANKLSTKMLSIMLSVFLELATKGFCVPQDLLSDEEQKEENDTKTGDGFGFEDGDGEKDVSDKLESEDQLDEARKPEDYNKGDQQEKDCKEEEKGVDMSDDFDGKMQDVDKNDDSDSDAKEDEKDELDKEMGETEEGADKLDDQIWGSDEENEPEEQEEDKNEETGKKFELRKFKFELKLNF